LLLICFGVPSFHILFWRWILDVPSINSIWKLYWPLCFRKRWEVDEQFVAVYGGRSHDLDEVWMVY
jgi:hypothetical protein